MKIDQIRIYAEVLEQGMDFKNYINSKYKSIDCINIYTKKGAKKIDKNSSVIDKIRAFKDVDVLITAISDNCEYPLVMIEYSTAVPTDDHKMQRSDVYFWGAAFKVPVMKISPASKGLDQEFGGGKTFTDQLEIFVANNLGALLFPIVWNTIPNTNILQTNPNALSCIAHSLEIDNLIDLFISTFILCKFYSDYYSDLGIFYRKKYGEVINDKTISPLNYIKNSTRLKKQDGKVCKNKQIRSCYGS